MVKLKNPLDPLKFHLETVNWERYYEEDKQRKQDAAIQKELERIAEQKRVDDIRCPVCDSKDKDHIVKSDSNGIMGPGYSSWITEEYIVCTNCGVMYKDLNRGEENNR